MEAPNLTAYSPLTSGKKEFIERGGGRNPLQSRAWQSALVEILPIMSTLTLELDSNLAQSLEELARLEHKPVETWARDRLRLATLETESERLGYPKGWIRLFGSIDDDTFEVPDREDF